MSHVRGPLSTFAAGTPPFGYHNGVIDGAFRFTRGLRPMSWRIRNRLRKRAAFWYLTRERIAVAVLSSAPDEPLLVSCSWVEASAAVASGSSGFCPGILEAARAASAIGMPQVVGLGAEHCGLETERGAESADGVRVPAEGTDAWVAAQARTLDEVEELFATAGLRLAVVDSEHCALLTLGDVLGISSSESADVDPLMAVSVSAGCEREAAAAGQRLCVPVGLALAWLAGGAGGHG